WLGWYHVTVWTYGQWLLGDLRGWRARHHREHCEGDYKHRPDPAAHRETLERSRRLMTRDPVKIEAELRRVVVEAFVARLTEFQVQVLVASMGAKHLHVLAKFPEHDPRIKIGIAKQFATKALKAHCSAVGIDLGIKTGDGIWGKRSHAEPVRDRKHQVSTVPYIVGHADEGAAVWLTPALAGQFGALLRVARSRRKTHG
ncbi:MAG TPA: hypothetical protein VF624_02505, partial [Tepidisphaeraceae bacterium]